MSCHDLGRGAMHRLWQHAVCKSQSSPTTTLDSPTDQPLPAFARESLPGSRRLVLGVQSPAATSWAMLTCGLADFEPISAWSASGDR
jgi:hypothetical protein